MFRRINWRYFDFWLFGVVLLLSIFGIIMIRSAAAGSDVQLANVRRQIIFGVISLVVVLSVTVVDYHYWEALVRPMYTVTLFLLIVVFVTAKARFGAARWLETGLFSIQPSELAKIVIILVLAYYFAQTKDQPRDLRWIAKSGAITLGFVIWIVLQPNLSITIVILVLWFSMLWVSGLPQKYIFIMIGVGLVGGLVAFPFLEPYQQERVISFLFPDPNSTYGNSYNVTQALISIGSGGLFGMGYGHGTQVQLRFLKVRHTDFIFSTIAEEFGFVGTVIVLLLLFFVVYRCLRISIQASDRFGSLIAFGFGILILFQTAVNVGVNLKVIPVTGLTLPFVSYGGSSLLSMALGIGLVESIALRRKPLEF
jgi:rod shape determining protein RodA